jgi:hypothetical protein
MAFAHQFWNCRLKFTLPTDTGLMHLFAVAHISFSFQRLLDSKISVALASCSSRTLSASCGCPLSLLNRAWHGSRRCAKCSRCELSPLISFPCLCSLRPLLQGKQGPKETFHRQWEIDYDQVCSVESHFCRLHMQWCWYCQVTVLDKVGTGAFGEVFRARVWGSLILPSQFLLGRHLMSACAMPQAPKSRSRSSKPKSSRHARRSCFFFGCTC